MLKTFFDWDVRRCYAEQFERTRQLQATVHSEYWLAGLLFVLPNTCQFGRARKPCKYKCRNFYFCWFDHDLKWSVFEFSVLCSVSAKCLRSKCTTKWQKKIRAQSMVFGKVIYIIVLKIGNVCLLLFLSTCFLLFLWLTHKKHVLLFCAVTIKVSCS